MFGNAGGGFFQGPTRSDMGLGPSGQGGEQEQQQQQQQQQGGPRKHGRFYKTRLCHAFQAGRCTEGAECKYAHGEADLRTEGSGFPARPPPPPQQQMQLPLPPKGPPGLPQPSGGPDPSQEGVVVRVHLCMQFMKHGNCRYGDQCKFAHGPELLGSTVLRPDQVGAPGVGDPSRRGPGGGLPPRPGPPTGGPDMPMGLLDPFAGPQVGAMSAAGLRAPLMPVHGPMGGPVGPAPPPGPPPPGTPAAMSLQHGGPQHPATGAGGPKQQQAPAGKAAAGKAGGEVVFVDRVRAVCALLGIGNAADVLADKPAALHHAVATIRNGSVFRENPFADSVEHLVL